jgi:ATP-dependent DNA helicase RecG
LREILLNAVMHRDYADPSGYVAIAVFDDRVEIRSVGRLPAGLTVAMLTGPHLSRPRNPLIADTFHRTGAVEIWGRGTNRVIEECQRYGVSAPTFEEQAGSLVVTFRAPVGPSPKRGHQAGTKLALSEHQVLSLAAADDPQPLQVLMERCGRTDRTKFRNQVLRPLVEAGLLAPTIPEKPRSPRQRYRTTEAGKALLKG